MVTECLIISRPQAAKSLCLALNCPDLRKQVQASNTQDYVYTFDDIQVPVSGARRPEDRRTRAGLGTWPVLLLRSTFRRTAFGEVKAGARAALAGSSTRADRRSVGVGSTGLFIRAVGRRLPGSSLRRRAMTRLPRRRASSIAITRRKLEERLAAGVRKRVRKNTRASRPPPFPPCPTSPPLLVVLPFLSRNEDDERA